VVVQAEELSHDLVCLPIVSFQGEQCKLAALRCSVQRREGGSEGIGRGKSVREKEHHRCNAEAV